MNLVHAYQLHHFQLCNLGMQIYSGKCPKTEQVKVRFELAVLSLKPFVVERRTVCIVFIPSYFSAPVVC